MIATQLRFNALRSCFGGPPSIGRNLGTTASFLRVVHSAGAIARSSSSRRGFATGHASRPKAHTGRTTSKPRKKRDPASAADGSAKASTPRRRQASKSKPKAKKKAKKPVSEESKARAEKRKKLEQIRALKKLALRTPKRLPETVYTVIASEMSKEAKGLAGREAAAKYKSLSPADLEHYNHIKNQNKQSNTVARAAWIASVSPDDIRKANLARRQLKAMGVKPVRRQIKDDRQVKRPATAHALFMKDRYASGDMEHVAAAKGMDLIMREWKELSDTDKSSYVEKAVAEKLRYVSEVKSVYGREVASASPPA